MDGIFPQSSNQFKDSIVSSLMMFESPPNLLSVSWEQVPQLWLSSEDVEANGAGNPARDSHLDKPKDSGYGTDYAHGAEPRPSAPAMNS